MRYKVLMIITTIFALSNFIIAQTIVQIQQSTATTISNTGEHNQCGSAANRTSQNCGEHDQCGSSGDRSSHDCGDRGGRCTSTDSDDCTLSVSLTPSNIILDSGQTESYSINTTGGVGPFNLELFNITGGKQQGSNVVSNSGNTVISFVTGATGTFGFNATSNDLGSSMVASSAANYITVYPAPVLGASVNGQVFDSGQTIIFTFTVNGGVGPFEIELFNITGNRQQGSNVIIQSPGGSNTLTFVAHAVGTFTYEPIATDMGTTTPFPFDPPPLTASIN